MGVDPVDLLAVAATGDGVAWSVSPPGIHVNPVVLGDGGSIGEHRNDEIDVFVCVLLGSASVVIDGQENVLSTGAGVLIQRGSTRAIRAGAAGVRYLTIHRERAPFAIGPRLH